MTENFKREEFQCPCCGLNNIDQRLVNLLQKAREMFGRPMVVTSGTRCVSHNQKVGGTPTSDHLLGFAADIDCENSIHRRELVLAALAVGIPTLGIKKDCIHLSIGEPARIFTYD